MCLYTLIAYISYSCTTQQAAQAGGSHAAYRLFCCYGASLQCTEVRMHGLLFTCTSIWRDLGYEQSAVSLG